MDLRDDLVQAIRAIGEKHPVKGIVLFGSRARGDNKPTSDIDLAVIPFDGFSEEWRIANDIDDLDTLLRIDVVFMNDRTDAGLIGNIRKEGIVLYERSQG